MLARLEFYGVMAAVFLIMVGAFALYVRSNHNTITSLTIQLQAANQATASLKASDDSLRADIAKIKIATDNANTDISLAQALADQKSRDIRATPPTTPKTNTKTLQGKVNSDTATALKALEDTSYGK